MKEELVSFETAKLAKEKGFKQWCGKRYSNNELESSPWPSQRFKLNGDIVKPDLNQVFAPTQSLLQKWLREVHQVFVHAEMGTLNKGKDLVIAYEVQVKEIMDFKLKISFIDDEYKTYEEALEVGLQEALKLIK